MTATIRSRTLVYDGWYKLWRLCVRMPNGVEVERHLEDHGAAVAVLPYDPVRRVAMLVSMPRAAVIDAGHPPLLEAIAGTITCDAEESARREAMEEGGVRLGVLEFVAEVWSLPALSSERLGLYLAPYGADDRVEQGGGAEGEHESITVHEIALEVLRKMRVGGALDDAKTLSLVQALELRRNELTSFLFLHPD
jgi:nudix-type nucleoside diphosphatase (YffH/AdpP family)